MVTPDRGATARLLDRDRARLGGVLLAGCTRVLARDQEFRCGRRPTAVRVRKPTAPHFAVARGTLVYMASRAIGFSPPAGSAYGL